MRQLRSVLPIWLVFLVAVAGCGGDDRLSKDEYTKELRAAVIQANTVLLKQGLAISRAPSSELAKARLPRLTEGLERSAAEIEQLKAPEDAEEANSEIARGIREVAVTARTLVANASTTSLRPLGNYENRLLASEGAKRMRTAVQQLIERGYELE